MTDFWLIANSMGGSTDEAMISAVRDSMTAQGYDLAGKTDLSREELPRLDGNIPGMIVSLGGDGTANAVIDRYGSEQGPQLLILPGGTMNLLASKLHGDADSSEIIGRLSEPPHITSLLYVEGPDFRSLVGIIAGPTAYWGDVREDLRQGSLTALAEDVPAALEATFGESAIRIAGEEGGHSALFVEARDDGLRVHDILAENIMDLAQHGWAWLNREFLGGPTRQINTGQHIIIEDEDGEIALLVDGERRSARAPLKLEWKSCPARFVTTLRS